jgi:hypothetical protein
VHLLDLHIETINFLFYDYLFYSAQEQKELTSKLHIVSIGLMFDNIYIAWKDLNMLKRPILRF